MRKNPIGPTTTELLNLKDDPLSEKTKMGFHFCDENDTKNDVKADKALERRETGGNVIALFTKHEKDINVIPHPAAIFLETIETLLVIRMSTVFFVKICIQVTFLWFLSVTPQSTDVVCSSAVFSSKLVGGTCGKFR
jgi:hypothetical protein